MKRWIRLSLWLAGVGCLCIPVLDDPPLATGAYLQDVATDAVTVAMVTAAPAVLVCEVRDAADVVVAEVRDEEAVRRHALRVGGLRAGASYRYALKAGREPLDAGSFRTAPAGDDAPVRFAFLGDSGGQPWWIWMQRSPLFHLPARWRLLPTAAAVTEVGAQVAAYQPDFLLHLGDVIYPWGHHSHYSTGFFRPFAEVLRTAPCYALLGNHDVLDAQGVQALANFVLPRNDLTGDSRCYTFAYGPLRVICLDCDDLSRTHPVSPEHPALRFLAAELARCTEPWIVVASHYPIRSASRQGNRADLMLHVEPLLAEYAVSLYLSGHDHCYQRFGPEQKPGRRVPLVSSGGGGKSLYEVSPGKGAAAIRSAYHWCSVELAGVTLRCSAHGIDGTTLDSFEIRLPEGDSLEELTKKAPDRASRIHKLAR